MVKKLAFVFVAGMAFSKLIGLATVSLGYDLALISFCTACFMVGAVLSKWAYQSERGDK